MYCGVPTDIPVSVIRLSVALDDAERDAEVGDERATLLQQDVLRLDVAMDDAVALRVVEGVATSLATGRRRDRELLLAPSRSRRISPQCTA